MALSENALLLGGFVLAHAVWRVSEISEGELLAPFVITEHDGNRQIHMFETEAHEDSIRDAMNFLEEAKTSVDTWAFAREGLLNEGGQKVDIVTITLWAKDMEEEAAIIQRFEPVGNAGTFRLIGEPMIVVAGVEQPLNIAKLVIETVIQGVEQHPKARTQWNAWQSD
jgi:hypothetical protein